VSEANRIRQLNTAAVEQGLCCLTGIEKDLDDWTIFEKAFQCRRIFFFPAQGVDEIWQADCAECTLWSNVNN